MQGGKGGSKTSTVEIPQWAQDLMRENLQRAEAQSRMGYIPFMGVDVAGLGPTGDLARQANVDAAIAYGLAPEGTKVAPSRDLRSYDLYTQQLAEARKAMPGSMDYYDQFFIDPVTGAAPLYDQARIAAAAAEEARRSGRISPVLYNMNPSSGSEDVNPQGKAMFTPEEFANLAMNFFPGVGFVKTVGGVFDNLFNSNGSPSGPRSPGAEANYGSSGGDSYGGYGGVGGGSGNANTDDQFTL